MYVSNSHRPQLLDLEPLWGYMEKEREGEEEEEEEDKDKALMENPGRK